VSDPVRIGAPGGISDVTGLRIGRRHGKTLLSAKLMELKRNPGWVFVAQNGEQI
jgi:hypothetical protein